MRSPEGGPQMIQMNCPHCGWQSSPFPIPNLTHGGTLVYKCGDGGCRQDIAWQEPIPPSED